MVLLYISLGEFTCACTLALAIAPLLKMHVESIMWHITSIQLNSERHQHNQPLLVVLAPPTNAHRRTTTTDWHRKHFSGEVRVFMRCATCQFQCNFNILAISPMLLNVLLSCPNRQQIDADNLLATCHVSFNVHQQRHPLCVYVCAYECVCVCVIVHQFGCSSKLHFAFSSRQQQAYLSPFMPINRNSTVNFLSVFWNACSLGRKITGNFLNFHISYITENLSFQLASIVITNNIMLQQ